jgi:hypothetical protein
MTKQEAIQAMTAGRKVTHTYFTDNEWVSIKGDVFVFEDGVKCPPWLFWMDRKGEG